MTMGMINHTRMFQMELLRTTEAVMAKHDVCVAAMQNYLKLAKTVLL